MHSEFEIFAPELRKWNAVGKVARNAEQNWNFSKLGPWHIYLVQNFVRNPMVPLVFFCDHPVTSCDQKTPILGEKIFDPDFDEIYRVNKAIKKNPNHEKKFDLEATGTVPTTDPIDLSFFFYTP